MDTRFWGPSGWRLLHLMVSTPLKDRDTEVINESFRLLPYVLPCKFCRYSLSEYIEELPVPTQYNKLFKWLYEIHNKVNDKLRSQNILRDSNPSYDEISERYKVWADMPCASTQMLGWNFLFSIANTTPSRYSKSTPIKNAPEELLTPDLRNRWNTMKADERIEYIQKWWDLLGHVLPFEPWRKAWLRSQKSNGLAPVKKGSKAVLSWLYKMELDICYYMTEQAPHNSFGGLCKEITAFSSGCSSNKSTRIKTCRAKKVARETLRRKYLNDSIF